MRTARCNNFTDTLDHSITLPSNAVPPRTLGNAQAVMNELLRLADMTIRDPACRSLQAVFEV